MSATPEQRLAWRAELQGAEGVKAKMQALLNLQREGSNASEKTRFQAKAVTQEFGMQNRALSALSRSWQIGHQNLALLTRGFSSLAAVGRTVLNVITSINLMQIRQRAESRELRDITQQLSDTTAEYLKNLSLYGADDPRTLDALQRRNKLFEDQADAIARIDAGKLQDISLGIGAVMESLGTVGQIATSIAVFKALGIGISGAAFAMAAFVGSIVALGALIILTNDQFDALLKTLGLFDIVYAIDATWQDFKKDWIEIFTVLGMTVSAFALAIPKYFQILGIRAVRFFTDMWQGFLNIINTIGNTVKTTVKSWTDSVVKFFKDLYDKIVGHSIWTDMLDTMVAQTREKLPQIATEFEQLGTRVIGSIERIDAIARTRSLVGAERQELHQSQVSAHVLQGISGTGRRAGMTGAAGAAGQRMNIGLGDPNYNLFGSYLMAANPGSIGNIQSMMGRGVAFTPNQDDFSSAQRWGARNGITIIVQGSLIAEKDLINKVSEAIAGNTQALIR